MLLVHRAILRARATVAPAYRILHAVGNGISDLALSTHQKDSKLCRSPPYYPYDSSVSLLATLFILILVPSHTRP